MNKIKLITGLILLVIILGAAGFFVYSATHKPKAVQSVPAVVKPTATKFIGGLKSVSDQGVLKIDGSFSSKDFPELAKDERIVNVSLNSQTKITRAVVTLPTKAELAKTKGYFNGQDLKRTEGPGSLETIKKDLDSSYLGVTVYVTASSNIYGKTDFAASEIRYEFSTEPQ